MINQIFMRRMGRGVAGLLLLIALCAAMASAASPRVKWRRLSPAHKPSARVNMVMAYDPVGQNIVMFGGFDGTSYLNDTWIFNGTDWVQLSPANAPPVRSATAISFDRVTNTMVLFGGFNGTQYLGDTWLWDSAVQNWTEAHPTTAHCRDSADDVYGSDQWPHRNGRWIRRQPLSQRNVAMDRE